jgi:hypothetical protein
MVGEPGNGPGQGKAAAPADLVGWVNDSRRAAAWDLLAQLRRLPEVDQVVLVTPEAGPLAEMATVVVQTEPGPIHFGRQLATLVDQFTIDRLLYFGGGAAPLLDDGALASIVHQLASAENAIITNNRFASDWAAITPATTVSRWIDWLPQDNMLGWVLSAEAGLSAYSQPATAATRLDIDTPTDLLALKLHPGTKERLSAYLGSLPLDDTPLRKAVAVLRRPASQVLVAGRFGPDVWQALNRATHCWVRVLSEERGMVSSGRQRRGEVLSLFGDYLATIGVERFFAGLPALADAAFIDSRVLMAHRRNWPDEQTRFASDLGLLDQIDDPWLRDFTAAAWGCAIPVILGGHGLMAGDMLAMVEIL